ncbi:MAG: helix-turn-helix domain-containing protein [Oscillospiraceae bacterium]|nr:helix-turn-helix domain-containing protein [Oscillospiraceae bacterium]
MDQVRTGELIKQLRTEMHLTQKQLAERLCVSDKAVSKWERGNGCPDIALLSALADVFGTDMQVLLSGEINKNESEKGNMKKLKFYICKACGNIITASSEAAVTCCGARLTAEVPRKAAENEMLQVEETDGGLFLTAAHEMTKSHYISFVAYLNDSTVMLFKQYPEWNLQVTMPLFRSGRLVWYCTECGLLYQDLRKK